MTNETNSQHLRILEAVLFAASEPLDIASIADRLPEGSDVEALLSQAEEKYQNAGFNLVRHGGKYAFKTAADLSASLLKEVTQQRRLSRAALETLAIIAYHQPVTRAEIEDIRGVAVSKGTLDVLLETEWVKIRGRRRVPGRPVTYGTTDFFLSYFDLETVKDLPGLEELRAAGLLDGRLPPGFSIPEPDPDNDPEEDALTDADDLEPLEMDLDEDFVEAEGETQAANG
jgi:segregation and condensation protein B